MFQIGVVLWLWVVVALWAIPLLLGTNKSLWESEEKYK